ncbi:MAG: hypothetical protein LC749_11345 [Actinobacteria bacterium]|nr:hypothetical protein [Actinomycetota bacterium]
MTVPRETGSAANRPATIRTRLRNTGILRLHGHTAAIRPLVLQAPNVHRRRPRLDAHSGQPTDPDVPAEPALADLFHRTPDYLARYAACGLRPRGADRLSSSPLVGSRSRGC